MILRKFDYFEFAGEPNEWSLNGLVLDNINLVVGKNATGKSNTLAKIGWLGDMIAGKQHELLESGNYDVEFFDGSDIYRYKLDISEHTVRHEELTLNGSIFLKLGRLVRWAESLRIHIFNLRQEHDMVEFYINGFHEFEQNFKDRIIGFMGEIGYELQDIGISEANSTIYVEEKNVKSKILLNQMSQGMYRALSLIIQITYNTFKKSQTTILIDDIGEGLDFDRSASLIKLISTIADDGMCQLIMSTNDHHVMNNVPLKYWQIIQRDGGLCTVHNYHNKKEAFDKFQYTGLNNFDFLASDFINSEDAAG